MPSFLSSGEINYLRKLAETILKDNIYTEGNDCGYTAASGKLSLAGEAAHWLYPFQWLWDTFFIAAWNTDTQQSLIDAEKFLNSQQDNGFCGHIRYNRQIINRNEYFPPANIYYSQGKIPDAGEVISKITQPPNIGYGLYELATKLGSDSNTREKLVNLFHKAYKYHQYIYKNRMIDGCMVTVHPWEAGDDNSPKWDSIYQNIIQQSNKNGKIKAVVINWLTSIGIKFERLDTKIINPNQRPIDLHYYIYLFLIYLYGEWHWDDRTILTKSPFRILDPMTNAILLRSDIDLLKLAELLDIKDTTIRNEINAWITISKAGLEKLWSDKHRIYLTKDLNTNSLIDIKTVSGLTPIICPLIPADHVNAITAEIENLTASRKIKYIVPSTFPQQRKYYEPNRYWRGPVWIIINELLAQGLSQYNKTELARTIRNSSFKLIISTLNKRGGFFEYYNPENGAGLGSAKQSWTAAAIMEGIRNYGKDKV